MKISQEVIEVVAISGIPEMIVAFFPFWKLKEMKAYSIVFFSLFFIQLLLICLIGGIAGMYAGFGSGGRSPWDGMDSEWVTICFGVVVFLIGRILRKIIDFVGYYS